MIDRDGSSRHPGWVARLGTGRAYVRYPDASHGHWLAPEQLEKGGRAKERRPPKPVGEPEVGARVVARWTDGKLYDGIVAKVRRGRFGREVRVCFDDGSERWTPEPRVWVTKVASPRVPQDRRDEPLPDAWLEPGRIVGARVRDGHWRKGTIAARRGNEVWVDFDAVPTRKGTKTLTWESQWASGRELAFAPEATDPTERRFPAMGAGLLVVTQRKQRHGYEVLALEGARAKSAIGDRLAVETDGGGARQVGYEDVWRRDDRRPPSDTSGLEVGAAVLGEVRPGEVKAGTVRTVGTKKRAGLVRVGWADGEDQWVDPARLEPLPEPTPEPEPPPPPPPEPEPEPLEAVDEIRSTLLQLVQRWTGPAGYRDGTLGRLLDDDGHGARLPVDVGVLSVRIREARFGWGVSITAATGTDDDPAPPPDGAMVRLASWVRGLFARAEDPEARAAVDRAWAEATFETDQTRVARAGGALSVEIPCAPSPPTAHVEAWARAVHERLFES